MSSTFVECLNKDACLGIIEPELNPSGECAEYYKGFLCGDCWDGYTIDEKYVCNKCPDSTINIVRLTFITLGFIILIVFLIRYLFT